MSKRRDDGLGVMAWGAALIVVVLAYAVVVWGGR